ncbi:hypothetical protein CMI37_21285 [Candidatus Pacearchaeota archaeon]|nr:hypothetical protein [Candidatus Pacearchaeota archaeon]
MFSREGLFQFAIQSVEIRTGLDKSFSVVYWSPLLRDYRSIESLQEDTALSIKENIQTRLALEWGASNVEN